MTQSQFVALARKIRPWQLVLVIMIAYLSIVLIAEGGDTKTFVQIGSCYSQCAEVDLDEGCPKDTEEGYDGQFVYYIARHPSEAAPCIDVPAYRYQRILLPILGRYVALGIDDLMPMAFVLINLVTLVGSTALLEQLLVQVGVSRWFAITYGLFFGSVVAVRVSTTEPLAYGLVVVAIWLSQQENERLWLQAVLLALAAFAKETTGLFVAGFMLYYALEKRWTDAIRLALVVGIPFGLWQLYLYDWLGAFGIGSGGAGGTSFEIIPYNGIWRIAYDDKGSLAAFVLLGILFIPSVMLPSVWGLWATIREFREGKYHLYTCLFFATLAIMPFVPFSTYREFIGIYRFIVGMVMMHILYCGLRYQGRPLVYSTLWLVLLFIVVFI
jgi:hypothetical protein